MCLARVFAAQHQAHHDQKEAARAFVRSFIHYRSCKVRSSVCLSSTHSICLFVCLRTQE